MATLTNTSARAEILSRLRRAEGQLRGIQRMVEEGAACLDIGQQFLAARKALDSTYLRMTMCMLEQELEARFENSGKSDAELGPLMADVQKMLSRMA